MDDKFPHLLFRRVTPAHLAHIGQDVAYSYLDGDPLRPQSVWLVDGEQINWRLLRPLELIGYQSMRSSQRQSIPGEQWGELQIVREGIGLAEMCWSRSSSGYYIPVPKGWITQRLAGKLSELGTAALRYEVPPVAPVTYVL